ncbi:MAG: helix-hairpin-helix domain-containing protein [Planctomycetota bacterium]|jgi:putative hydrolase
MPGAAKSDAGLKLNRQIADRFDEMAALLEARHANDFRIRAYRRGARVLRELMTSVAAIFTDSGRRGLEEIPGIGRSLALAIDRYLHTGRIPQLNQLRDADTSESRFRSVAGVGPKLAARIHKQLHVDTLGELQAAAMDGSLEDVPGIGKRRAQAVRDSIEARARSFAAPQRAPRDEEHHDEPPVGELLSIDAEYREKAAGDSLLRIAPKRFNPTDEAWLPILHARREGRHYDVMFSNTAHAHELGMTHDWVIIRRTDRNHRGQWTVITSLLGNLKGRRIVRGRESECLTFYRQHPFKVTPAERFIPEGEPRQLSLFQ